MQRSFGKIAASLLGVAAATVGYLTVIGPG